ncbi:hypothetical protein Ga0123461_1961 [Mariprofundus aestuarium]|uniref:Small metal-binding protein n=1 Tax=Mariprofundus aestuarium TaxID=1921086 RepID=A0A2K8KZF1_MARES|nr:hypothetical protein [Mariprofundus aestuarium]ATX80367.1 hypothetical protein Ga0123461_1961 [Mariprofundus aestuarium]
MKKILFLFSLLAFSLPAHAGLTSVEDRAQEVRAQVEGNNNYHAELARQFATIAVTEKGEHDTQTAQEFIKMAEEHAAQAGGAQ